MSLALRTFLLFCLWCGPVLDGSAAAESDTLQQSSDPFRWSAAPLQLVPGVPAELLLTLSIPKGTYIYRDKLEVVVAQALGVEVAEPLFPRAMLRSDPADPQTVRALYEGSVLVRVPLALATDRSMVPRLLLRVAHQGCVPGLCYPLRQRQLQPTLIASGGDEAPATQ